MSDIADIEIVEFGFGIFVEHHDNMNSYVFYGGRQPKHFFGETAWMDAERYAGDKQLEKKYA